MKVKDIKAVLLPTKITYIDRDGNELNAEGNNYMEKIRERVVNCISVVGEKELIIEVYR